MLLLLLLLLLLRATLLLKFKKLADGMSVSSRGSYPANRCESHTSMLACAAM